MPNKAYKILARNVNDPCAPWRHIVAGSGPEMEQIVRELVNDGWKVHVRECA